MAIAFAPNAAPMSEPASARRLAALAVESLRNELALYPKPGLVSGRDAGAHEDMTAMTFLRSIVALKAYFGAIAAAGMRDAPFAELKRLGVAAEARMLRATCGVNTHRGAIFTLGLLAAAGGRVQAIGRRPTDRALRDTVWRWRRDLTAVAAVATIPSHGTQMASRYGAKGARGEASSGFPAIFDVALPALRDALSRGADSERACLHALFALLAVVTDTNVLYRAGTRGLALIRDGAAAILAADSVFAPGWYERAELLHDRCCAARVSPGGCADLLAGAWFIHRMQTAPQ
jgi:triphosphoribosyl-dephospho-CoA synthase